ncbi:type II toxin-antitoxin system RelE/ParE family toxin [Microbacterium aurum]|uniref:type II toxin-antitoxin system RelE/ParE family toxin n=1 Tax=Microbacterium aurum TaxID=36805 RepID=UPI00248D8522|nr:type II toxin-antitoxin system RelE/ParE family toxin [Microbacterium aurum]MBZ6371757.1 type II toxin-antitoxin system RelE/ParE family toxin [Microbacterium hominis]
MRSAIERIAEQPDRGRAVDETRTGYRRYAIGSHLIFFTESDSGVDVIPILHLRMDSTRHL